LTLCHATGHCALGGTQGALTAAQPLRDSQPQNPAISRQKPCETLRVQKADYGPPRPLAWEQWQAAILEAEQNRPRLHVVT